VAKGRLTREDADAAVARLAPAEDLATAAATADFAIETVIEHPATKQEVMRVLQAHGRPDLVAATNTSAISITEIAAGTDDPARIVGMHFFNPVPRLRLVEIIRGRESSDATVQAAMTMGRRLGKEPVEVRDIPGFVVTRVNALLGNEAFRMLSEGVASAADIDRAVRLGLNYPMGPLELGDLVGWDVRLAILEYLAGELGDRYAPDPLLVEYVRQGRLGRKTGRGVYDYD
jgi:3-hydroxybutyryl-CoA dehydrogenase